MATLIVRHKVKDFDAWKAAYDAFDETRTAMGVTDHSVYRGDGDPNEVTAYHHFNSMEQAKAFAASPELKDAMESAGVVGAPDIWFGNKV